MHIINKQLIWFMICAVLIPLNISQAQRVNSNAQSTHVLKYLSASGGKRITNQNDNLTLQASAGQAAAGRTQNDNYILNAGFWSSSNPQPQTSDIIIDVTNDTVFKRDTALINVMVDFNGNNSGYESFEIRFSSFKGKANFVEVDTSNSLIGSAGWDYSVNNTDSSLNTAFAGGTSIYQNGKLFSMKFEIPETAQTDTVDFFGHDAMFNTGQTPILIDPGFIKILTPTYGDVDLNGLVQAYDASMIFFNLLGDTSFTPLQAANADVTTDSSISSLDASVILQYVVESVDSLPYSPNISAEGNIVMEDGPLAANSEVTVPIFIEDYKNIYGFEGTIDFDSQILTYKEFELASSIKDFITEVKVDSGRIKFVGAGESSLITDSLWANVTFQTGELAGDSATVELSKLRWNENDMKMNLASAVLSPTVGVNGNEIPNQYMLYNNYPNPFNPSTNIKYGIPEPGLVNLTIYNILGQEVTTLVNKKMQAGYHEVSFDASSLSSGMYIYRINVGEDFRSTKKMLLVK